MTEPTDHLTGALGALDDDTVRGLLAPLGRGESEALGSMLGLPSSALRRADHPADLLRTRLTRRPDDVRIDVVRALVAACLDDAVEQLGDAASDPSREDLLAVLDGLVERHGVEVTRLMLASMVAPDAKARRVCAEILDTDDRFALEAAPAGAAGPAPEHDDRARAAAAHQSGTDTDSQEQARRRERQAKKQAKKQARRREQDRRERAAAALREQRRRARREG